MIEVATELGPGTAPPLSGDRLPEGWRNAPREDWGRPGLKAVKTEDHLYVEYATGERELYDLGEDPHQLSNRYDDADPEQLRRLKERLALLRGCAGANCRALENDY